MEQKATPTDVVKQEDFGSPLQPDISSLTASGRNTPSPVVVQSTSQTSNFSLESNTKSSASTDTNASRPLQSNTKSSAPADTNAISTTAPQNITQPNPASFPLTSFHFFPKLPPELRWQIWHYLIQPSFVTLHYNGDRWSGTRSPQYPKPVLPKINKETRLLFLRKYCLFFSGEENRITDKKLGALYVNPKVDTMFLRFDDRLYFQSNRPRLMMEELNQIFENKIREEIRVILDREGVRGGERRERFLVVKARVEEKWPLR